jgi:hypothetical protein
MLATAVQNSMDPNLRRNTNLLLHLVPQMANAQRIPDAAPFYYCFLYFALPFTL